MSADTRLITGVDLDDQGFAVEWVESFENGAQTRRQIRVLYGTDYDDEIQAVLDAVNALIDDVAQDMTRMPALRVELSADEEEEPA